MGGVGYGVYMYGQAMGRLPAVGNEVKLFTYLNVKEDAMQLYGFLTRDDLLSLLSIPSAAAPIKNPVAAPATRSAGI